MKAAKFDGELRLIADAPVPRRKDEALIEVRCAGICSTDIEIVKGYAGFRGILGHEFVGRVVESPDSSWIGRRVVGEINVGCNACDLCRSGDPRHCRARTVLGIKGRDGAFAEFLSLPLNNLIEVPDSLPDEAAVFVEPLAAAARILDQIDIGPAVSVAVVGDGKLAQLIVRVLGRTGCALTVFGRHEWKLELALAADAKNRLATHIVGVGEDAKSESFAESFDVVIDATGSPSGLQLALGLARPLGKVVLKTTHYGMTSVEMSRVVVNEIEVVGSRCGRFRPAIDMLSAGAVSVEGLISEIFPLDDAVRAFDSARDPEGMKVLLRVADA
ncbi:MAG TPA: alcohol dehydrogenase catalytic domain-containing protein [Blastocatellia bacterium]|nr:alcohol dehydrogenase catalytic domain-containing protein [Blastocatellia bacterium]